jgi:predicted MFS family arabinose efflux permease
MRIPAIVYVLALGAFALITTELGVIGILPQVSEAFGITIDRAGWLLSGFALVIALLGPSGACCTPETPQGACCAPKPELEADAPCCGQGEAA